MSTAAQEFALVVARAVDDLSRFGYIARTGKKEFYNELYRRLLAHYSDLRMVCGVGPGGRQQLFYRPEARPRIIRRLQAEIKEHKSQIEITEKTLHRLLAE